MSAERKRIEGTRPDGNRPADSAAALIALVRLLARQAALELHKTLPQQRQDDHGHGQA